MEAGRRTDDDAARSTRPSIEHWLADGYTPGELWNTNLLGGTSLIRLMIVVEGRTEEEFVKQLLITVTCASTASQAAVISPWVHARTPGRNVSRWIASPRT